MSSTEKPFFLTTVGKKYLMATTGLIWAGFVFTHMAGNMLLLVSANTYNAYSHKIITSDLLYVAEGVLLISFIIHVMCAVSITLENRKAKGPQSYRMQSNGEKGVYPASRFMIIHGSALLAFLIYHLITFKYGTYYETTVNGVVMRDLHRLVVEVFESPAYVFGYSISVLLLGLHLSHGFGAAFLSLGVVNDRNKKIFNKLSFIYAVVVAFGFLSQPIYIFMQGRI